MAIDSRPRGPLAEKNYQQRAEPLYSLPYVRSTRRGLSPGPWRPAGSVAHHALTRDETCALGAGPFELEGQGARLNEWEPQRLFCRPGRPLLDVTAQPLQQGRRCGGRGTDAVWHVVRSDKG
jgi:hypothetical protein